MTERQKESWSGVLLAVLAVREHACRKRRDVGLRSVQAAALVPPARDGLSFPNDGRLGAAQRRLLWIGRRWEERPCSAELRETLVEPMLVTIVASVTLFADRAPHPYPGQHTSHGRG